jgi:hypothetical protein
MNGQDIHDSIDQVLEWITRNDFSLYLAAVAILAIITFAVAVTRGWGVWAVLLALIVPLGSLIALCLPPRRRCPECARFNFAAARICRYCGRDIAPPPPRRRAPSIWRP